MKKKSALLRSLVALTASAALLAGCGGGGGDGPGPGPGTAPAPAPVTPPETNAPNTAPIPATTALGSSRQYEGSVAGCSLETQKKFARAYLDEVYLWYREIPNVDPASYTNIPDYFNALLVRTPDATGQERDRFSTVLPASQAANVMPSPGTQQADLGTAQQNHTRAVPITRVVTSPAGRRVGYIQFNDHSFGAQDDLITAFRQLQSGGGVQDLVLDLRQNSGGFLYVAVAAASMITGPQNEGKVFEQLRYNDKRQAESTQSTLLFSNRVQFTESQYPLGSQLPQLALPRLFVLTTPTTCSASESIINGLRGIDVQVIQIGTPDVSADTGLPGTCGKPYGFHQKNNCGWAYFPLEFQGTNAKGFGDYTTGFRNNCQVADNGGSRGTTSDSLFSAALTYADTGACPAGLLAIAQSSGTPLLGDLVRPGRPAWAGRVLLPSQQVR